MGIFSRLFGGSQVDARPAPKQEKQPTNLDSQGLPMHPEPWEFPGLPPGLTGQDIQDAATALASMRSVGRVIPLAAQRRDNLSGTAYDHNAARIRAALNAYPSLRNVVLLEPRKDEPIIGHLLPAILWRDSSPAEETRPVACIGPNGYFGSLYYGPSRELNNFVRAEAKESRLLAGVVEILPPDVRGYVSARLWHPSAEEIARYRRWLKSAAGSSGDAFRPATEFAATLRRTKDYQEELDHLLSGREKATLKVQLALEPTGGRGKYADQNLVRAMVQDRTIGIVPAQERDSVPQFFAAVESGVTTGQAHLIRYPESISAKVSVAPI